jgi:hypothetical protein
LHCFKRLFVCLQDLRPFLLTDPHLTNAEPSVRDNYCLWSSPTEPIRLDR